MRHFFTTLFLILSCTLAVTVAHAARTPWSSEVTQDTLLAVMPEATDFSEKQGTPPVYSAYKTSPDSDEKELIGYVYLSADVPPEEKGYSAPIDMIIGLGVDGKLTGLKVLDYVESFRYSRGDFLSTEGFQEQFTGKSIRDKFHLRHDVDAVSNATITSWAIARAVRNSSRQVATAYLNYTPDITDADIWSANAASHLAELSWGDLLAQGLVVQQDFSTLLGATTTLSIAYIGRPALGDYFIGADDYAAADRVAGIRYDTREMILFMVGGDTSQPFKQEGFAYQQGDDSVRRIHPRRIISAGNAEAGAIAGKAEFAGAIAMDEDFDPTRPFTFLYTPRGAAEPVTFPYHLSGISLSLVKGEPVLSPAELENERLLSAPWTEQLRHGVLWQDTDWLSAGLLAALMALIMAAFLKKSSTLRWTALTLTFCYLGFYNGQFLSVSHIAALVSQGPGNIMGNVPLFLLVTFTLITTLLWGRIFCASLCPFGALQDFITRLVPKRWALKVPQVMHDRALWIKYGLLGFIVAVALIDNSISVFQYLEPFGTLFYFSQSLLLWAILIAILIGCVLVDRFYCRYLCPLGAALALIALISPFRIKRVPQCNICKVCEHACPTGAIRGPDIDFKECVRCDLCEIKLIEKAGTCRHSVGDIIQRSKDTDIVKILTP